MPKNIGRTVNLWGVSDVSPCTSKRDAMSSPRVLFLFGLVFATALYAAVTLPRQDPTVALACSRAPDYLDDLAQRAEVVALVEAIQVGDSVNRAPALTATSTATLTATSSPDPRTRTPRPAVRTAFAKTMTAEIGSALPTDTPEPPVRTQRDDLTGIGATLRLVQVYVGNADDDVQVDNLSRARAEASQRFFEANPILSPVCPDISVRYTLGGQVLALLGLEDGSYETVSYLPIDATGEFVTGNFGVHLATYRRFFADVDARISPPEGDFDGAAYLQTERLPLASVIRMITGLRSGGSSHIVPPDTGSAGLAAAR
jgi:hypothetical protein